MLDKTWLAQLRTAFEDLILQQQQVAGSYGQQESGTRHLNDLVEQGALFERIYTHPRLLAAVHEVLQQDFRLSGLHGRDPLPGYGQQGLHADWPTRAPNAPFQVVTSLWLLDDFSADNGPTRVVPGTHLVTSKLDKNMANPNSTHPRQVLITAQAGSVLVFNGHLWHSGTRNLSQKSRRVITCAFIELMA
jgi:ectoine hydroxylase-related dioxygenase (phytanoyl-CoA dioxygenase family)